MKKLMIGLVGAAAMVACAEVESGNIVGFHESALVDNANHVAAMFDDVGNEGINIQSIIPKSDDMWGGAVTLKLLRNDLADLDEYLYVPAEESLDGTAGWYTVDDQFVEHTFMPGEGFILVNSTENTKHTIAGQVFFGKPTFELGDNANQTGNITPLTLDIQDIALGTALEADGSLSDVNEEIYGGAVTLKLLNSDLSDDVEYLYVPASESLTGIAGWFTVEDEFVTREFAPGEGFFLVNSLETAWAQLPAAITK